MVTARQDMKWTANRNLDWVAPLLGLLLLGCNSQMSGVDDRTPRRDLSGPIESPPDLAESPRDLTGTPHDLTVGPDLGGKTPGAS